MPRERVRSTPGFAMAEGWFAARGWQPFAFQREVWAAMAAGRSGLLHATTGSGKTYAVWFGALLRGLALAASSKAPPSFLPSAFNVKVLSVTA